MVLGSYLGGNQQDKCWARKRGRGTRETVQESVKIHRNSTHAAAEGEYGRQSGRGKMVSAATDTGLGSSRVRRKNQ